METVWLKETDSTNSHLRRLVESQSCKPPFVLATDSQTAGRGRGSHAWWSPHGCLMFSMLLDSREYASEFRHIPQAALVVGLAITELLGELVTDSDVEIKWPNDVYIAGKKVSGILLETVAPPVSPREPVPAFAAWQTSPSASPSWPWWILGVGINLEIDWTEAPLDVRDKATCLRSHLQLDLDKQEFLHLLSSRIDAGLCRWRDQFDEFLDAYRRHCFLSGRMVAVNVNQETVTGYCEGIDDSGGLRIRRDRGSVVIHSGAVLNYSEDRYTNT